MFMTLFGSNRIRVPSKKVKMESVIHYVGPPASTVLRLFGSILQEQFSFIKRKTSLPVDHFYWSVDFDWLHQSLAGYSGAGDSKVSLSPTLWQKLLLNGRVASFSVGVPPGPTGRDNQTGQLQTGRPAEVVAPWLRPRHIWEDFRWAFVVLQTQWTSVSQGLFIFENVLFAVSSHQWSV